MVSTPWRSRHSTRISDPGCGTPVFFSAMATSPSSRPTSAERELFIIVVMATPVSKKDVQCGRVAAALARGLAPWPCFVLQQRGSIAHAHGAASCSMRHDPDDVGSEKEKAPPRGKEGP